MVIERMKMSRNIETSMSSPFVGVIVLIVILGCFVEGVWKRDLPRNSILIHVTQVFVL